MTCDILENIQEDERNIGRGKEGDVGEEGVIDGHK